MLLLLLGADDLFNVWSQCCMLLRLCLLRHENKKIIIIIELNWFFFSVDYLVGLIHMRLMFTMLGQSESGLLLVV
jgi:hypothetical protein